MGDRLDVRTIARGRWPGILSKLGLDERALSGQHGPCPLCGGKDRFRFDDKDGRGTYFCSGCGPNDGVNLAMGITGLPFKEVARCIEQLATVVPPTVGKVDRTATDKLAALHQVWRDSTPIHHGDEAHRYLLRRGLSLYDLPENIRTHPGLKYRDGETVSVFPAMVAQVTDRNGQTLSLHRTYLEDAQKAPVATPKKLMPSLPLAGSAIRLTPVSQVLGIAEGIETALAASEIFGIPVWSCISTSGIESFDPPEGITEVVIFADNDENFAGQLAAYRAAHRLKLKGYAVEVVIPTTAGDWLDELKRQKAQESFNFAPNEALIHEIRQPAAQEFERFAPAWGGIDAR